MLAGLDSFIRLLQEKKTPVVPKIFAEFRYMLGSLVAEPQARCADAIVARAIHKLRKFAVGDPEIVYDNNAYTIIAFYEGFLRLYARRPIQPTVPGGSTEYRMTLIDVGAGCVSDSSLTIR